MTRLPSPSRLVTTNPEVRSSLAGRRGRAVTAMMTTAAMVMGLGLATPRPVHAGPADIDQNYQDGSRDSAKALTQQGQASFDSGDYRGAAAAWTKILDTLPENEMNRAERENALLISLEAYKQAFRRASVERGSVSDADVGLLSDALALCDKYTKEATRVHGPGAVSPAVVESRVEIEGMLQDVGRTPAPSDPTPPVDDGTTEIPFTQFQGRLPSGNGLIGGGAATLVVGLSMMTLVIIGAQNRTRADEDRTAAEGIEDEAASETAIRQADNDKRSANAMLISGSVLMGVLTIGGATMLGIGIRRRIRYTAFAPTVGPSYVGVSLRGRF